MADEKASSTNVLLAQILQTAQDTNSTINLLLKVETDSRDLLKQLVESLSGEGQVYTVKVQQLAKQLARELKTGG